MNLVKQAIEKAQQTDKELITKIFVDGEDIKQITSDEYEVVIESKGE